MCPRRDVPRWVDLLFHCIRAQDKKERRPRDLSPKLGLGPEGRTPHPSFLTLNPQTESLDTITVIDPTTRRGTVLQTPLTPPLPFLSPVGSHPQILLPPPVDPPLNEKRNTLVTERYPETEDDTVAVTLTVGPRRVHSSGPPLPPSMP